MCLAINEDNNLSGMKGFNLTAIFSLVDPMIYFCFGFGDDIE
jgi:hypothetical protein